MKKLLMFVVCGIMISSYTNVCLGGVEQFRAACLKSNKTLWVERNQICIPRNPCGHYNPNINRYCISMFKDIETIGAEYLALVEIYAKTHNVSCKPVKQDAKLVGQDYVVCQGDDILVFEFDDIQDRSIKNFPKGEDTYAYRQNMHRALCNAIDGTLVENKCIKDNSIGFRNNCIIIKDVLDYYGLNLYEVGINVSGDCIIGGLKSGDSWAKEVNGNYVILQDGVIVKSDDK